MSREYNIITQPDLLGVHPVHITNLFFSFTIFFRCQLQLERLDNVSVISQSSLSSSAMTIKSQSCFSNKTMVHKRIIILAPLIIISCKILDKSFRTSNLIEACDYIIIQFSVTREEQCICISRNCRIYTADDCSRSVSESAAATAVSNALDKNYFIPRLLIQ